MENLDGLADGRVITTTRLTARDMSRETPQLAGCRNQAVPEVGVPLEEFGAQHNAEMYNPRPLVFRGQGTGQGLGLY